MAALVSRVDNTAGFDSSRTGRNRHDGAARMNQIRIGMVLPLEAKRARAGLDILGYYGSPARGMSDP